MITPPATIVLIANKNDKDGKLIASYLEQHFSDIELLWLNSKEASALAINASVALFIRPINSKIATQDISIDKSKFPWLSEVAFSSDRLDPVEVMSAGYSALVCEGNLDHLKAVIEQRLDLQRNVIYYGNTVSTSLSDFTGVHSRLEFLESVSKLIDKFDDNHRAILYLQLDNFGWINENQGMAAGDHYLKDIGAALNNIFDENDYVARYQGGNFILYITDSDRKRLATKADMVREAVRELTTEYNTTLLSSTASIGARIIDPELPLTELIANAYDASDIAKSNGGDNVHFYRHEKDESDENVSKRAWDERIKKAFENDLFVLYYQPIVNLVSESTPRYEVLLRMQDEQDTIISPGTFLPYAERAGLMADVDRKVINQALNQAVEHRENTQQEPELFIKLSGKTVDDTSMPSWVGNTLKEIDYPADKIVFEITESIALHHLVQTRNLCQKLRELNVKIALDHFGTRFRSFKLLEDLQVDYLKIDGSIIQHIATNKGHQAIIERIVKTSAIKGLQLIAESVQEADSLPLIWQNNIPMVQGFFLGVPTDKMEYDFGNLLI